MATASDESEIQEVFRLFDQDGSGAKIKEIGTIMRSLGLGTSEAQVQEFMSEASQKDKNFVQFADFLAFVKRAETNETDHPVDVAKEMHGMKLGILHFFEKLNPTQIRESPPSTVKISDLKHLLAAVGEKMSEEEIEEMAREIRNTCKVTDGRVDFSDFVNMIST
mmetsp:Transcript_56369/g.121907  ORF Transcript_56369/g.121907 Transcript_56369/m.121907 type:complete len:165 (-) Transcript_56369:141-635(-)